ncbi:MAG: acetate--CoA ligase family protein [Deltaproteobacteria bacterium]|nr:acetate--CoA ligase family protein [Deltaproteobacteria bacterium]
MRPILVTGSAGLVGTAFVRAAGRAGLSLRRFDPRERDAADRGDVRDPAALARAADGCGGIVHLAAVSRVVWAERDPATCRRTNVGGAANVLAAAAAQRPPAWVLLAGSREVYGRAARLPADEDTPAAPVNVYGESKLAAERLVLEARAAGARVAVVRLSNVYGSTADHADRVAPAFARAAALGEPLVLEGPEHVFDFTHVDDVAAGLLELVRRLEGGTFDLPALHLVTGRPTSLRRLAELAVAAGGGHSAIREAAPRTFDVERFWGDPGRARAVLGWEARIQVEDGIARLVADFPPSHPRPPTANSRRKPEAKDQPPRQRRTANGQKHRPVCPPGRARYRVAMDEVAAADTRLLDEPSTDRLLRDAGVPLVVQRFLPADAPLAEEAARLGWPVVLKARAPGLAHRTEQGAVAVGLSDRAALEAAAARMRARLDGTLDGWLVQPQAPAGLELIAGYLRDPTFGPTVLLGLGGTRAEADPDVALRLWPASASELRGMVDDLRGRKLLDGFRGASPVDRDALAALLAALGRLGAADPALTAIDLNPVVAGPAGLQAVDAMVWRGTTPPAPPERPPLAERICQIARFFEPRSVAVVGASASPRKAGHVILQNLLRLGFPGRIHPIHPRAERILDLPCRPTVSALGEPVDLVVAAIPREAIPELLEDCGRAGVRNLVVSTAGFSDGGPEGAEAERRLAARAHELGIRLMGPNSIGTVHARSRVVTSLASIEPVPAGGAAYLGQTGLLSSAFPRWFAATLRQGAVCFASLGNKADVDEADVLEYLAADPAVRVVGMYLEGLRDGRRLYETIAATTPHKPVVVLKSGRTPLGARAAASHTGALAADDRVADAALRQAGALRVDDFGALFDQTRAFERLVPPAGPRLGVVSITGVGCVLTADACGRHGLVLPELAPDTLDRIRDLAPPWAPVRNPVDMWSTIERRGPAAAYRELAAAVLEDPGVDALLLIFIHIPESRLDARETFGDLRARRPGKPVVAACFGGEPELDTFRNALEDLGIPVFDGPERAVQVLAGLRRHAARARPS